MNEMNSISKYDLVPGLIEYMDYCVFIEKNEETIEMHKEKINEIINSKNKLVKSNIELIKEIINQYIIPIAIKQYAIILTEHDEILRSNKFKNYVINTFNSVGIWDILNNNFRFNYMIKNNRSKPAVIFVSVCLAEYLILAKPSS
jgi:hypothetical protein